MSWPKLLPCTACGEIPKAREVIEYFQHSRFELHCSCGLGALGRFTSWDPQLIGRWNKKQRLARAAIEAAQEHASRCKGGPMTPQSSGGQGTVQTEGRREPICRPILFSGAMVKAILEGRKSQTRRVVKPANSEVLGYNVTAGNPMWSGLDFSKAVPRAHSIWGEDMHLAVDWWHPDDKEREQAEKCVYRVRPRWRVGERLWVKETWACNPYDTKLWFRATDELPAKGEYGPLGWRPSIFMPRSFSRITLEVTEVRVQRLQEISEEDAKSEGVNPSSTHDFWEVFCDGGSYSESATHPEPVAGERGMMGTILAHRRLTIGGESARYNFQILWDSINGKAHPWESNPFVWCLSFKRLEAL